MRQSFSHKGTQIQAESRPRQRPCSPVDMLLLRSPETWTEHEIRLVQASDRARQITHPDYNRLRHSIRRWYGRHYGNAPVGRDATGRPLVPTYQSAPPQSALSCQSTPSQNPQANDHVHITHSTQAPHSTQGVKKIHQRIEQLFGHDPMGVHIVQKGINFLEQSLSMIPLKTDGIFGAKTRHALKRTLARLGHAATEELLSLGVFLEYAERLWDGRCVKSLEQEADKAFAPLFSSTSVTRDAKKKFTPWGLGLQMACNEMGSESLLEDGWLGPRSEAVIQRLIVQHGPMTLVRILPQMLGFFS